MYDICLAKLHITVNVGLRVGFSQLDYGGLESVGNISVNVLITGGTLTDDITVTVIPYDQSPVSANGKNLGY